MMSALKKAAIGAFFVVFLTGNALAQAPFEDTYLPPTNLDVPNITQEAPSWGWAAVTEQILYYKYGPIISLRQCQIVSRSLDWNDNFCCASTKEQCLRKGSLSKIERILLENGASSERIPKPNTWEDLYYILVTQRPIILEVRTLSPEEKHFVLIQGISFAKTPFGSEALVHINDPLSKFGKTMPFSELKTYWLRAIAIY